MKHKTSLLLMEQLVMILVFALAAALCLQVFGKARTISEETACYDQAVILARNGAELLKASEGDTRAAESLGGNGYRVEVLPRISRQPGLSRAEVAVYYGENLVFSLETGWQEVLP